MSADEPRRSGRGNKGQHTKNVETEATPEPPKPKPKGKGKASKKKQYPAEGGVVDEDGEWIRCPCGKNEEDDEARQMVCCDTCMAWEHLECLGLPDVEYKGDTYYCERCDPNNHRDLLVALEQGSWATFVAERKEEYAKPAKAKGGKKGKGGRQSAAAESKQSSSPMPQSEPNKRKLAAEEGANGDTQTSKDRRGSSQPAKSDESASKKRKTSATTKQEEDKTGIATSIAELADSSRNKAATELRKRFADLVRTVTKKNLYRIPDGQTAESLGEKFALLVEHAMFKNLAGNPPNLGGAYRGRFIQINSNITKNEPLFVRLLDGSVTADEFANMSSEQMASEELQQQMAAMKEEVDKQSILQQEDGPRIRRTHKGEEFIDDPQNQATASESVISGPAPRRRESAIDDGAAHSPTTGYGQSPTGADFPIDSHKPPNTSPRLERSSSSNFNIRNVWDNVGSPDTEQRPFAPPPQRSASGAHSQQPASIKTDQHDADIDRLLDADGEDSAPYSPADYGPDTAVVWRGTIDMPVNENSSVAKFTTAARHIAGSDLSTQVSLSNIFPESIVLAGRIKPELADQYISGLSAASNTDVSVFTLDVADVSDNTAKAEFNKLFEYLSTRERYGVIKSYRDYIRDIYLVPLEAGMEKKPLFLERLVYNNIEEPRPRRLLLLTYILKWPGDRSTPQSAQATPSAPGGAQPSQSVPSAGSAMSPIGNDPQYGRQPQPFAPPSNAFPGNPYASTGAQGPSPINQAVPGQPLNDARRQNYDLARQILGDLTDTPVAQQILEQAESVQPESLQNLKYIFETFPPAREDFGAFQEALARQGTTGAR